MSLKIKKIIFFCLNLKSVFRIEMSSLPIFKLVSLLAKQLAKPLAIALKAKATTHPNLKNYVVLPTANGKLKANDIYFWLFVSFLYY